MKTTELLSVIVPVYNTEQYIDECIESIVNQSYCNLEIIIVDDGSTDGCAEKCDAWSEKDKRIRVIHQQNMGLSCARNKGVAESEGDYISFIDSDDYIDNDYYMVMMSSLKDTGSDIVGSGIKRLYKNSEIMVPMDPAVIYSPEEALKTVISGTTFMVTAWNKIFRRELITANAFPEGKYHEDNFVMYKVMSMCSTLSFCHSVFYHYRIRKNGIIGSGLGKRFDDKYDSFFQNQSIIRANYPRLQSKMEFLLLQNILNDYTELIDCHDEADEEMKRIIRGFRKDLELSLPEIICAGHHRIKYYLLSVLCFDAYCRHRSAASKSWNERYEYFD